jgi:hypothetical protein
MNRMLKIQRTNQGGATRYDVATKEEGTLNRRYKSKSNINLKEDTLMLISSTGSGEPDG